MLNRRALIIATKVNPPITPQIDGFGATIPSCIIPDTILSANPLICAVAAAVVATNVVTELIKNFIHAKV